jgi:hypothetical protein
MNSASDPLHPVETHLGRHRKKYRGAALFTVLVSVVLLVWPCTTRSRRPEFAPPEPAPLTP